MKILISFLFLAIATLGISESAHATVALPDTSDAEDEQELLMNWSLFHEDYRNGYYERAIPYGWKVMELNPTRFTSLYRNLAESYRQLYLEEEDEEKQAAYVDTIITVFQKGIEYLPDRADNYYLQKAHFYDNYYSPPKVEESIEAYEKAIELSFDTIEFDYIDRLGTLYMENIDADETYADRAIELYQRYLTERDPDSDTAMDRLQRLVRDPEELVELAENQLRTDPDNPGYIWNLVQAYNTAEQYENAIPHVERLIEMNPESQTYWNELARLHDRLDQYQEAIRAYQELMKLDPNDRDLPLNIARAYRQLENFQQARSYAQQASRIDPNWGEPLMEIATIYEEVVERCVVRNRGGWEHMELEDRVVYRLAQEYYQEAAQIDDRVAERARERAEFLHDLVPQDDHYFFNRELISNGKMEVFGACYEWIDEEITVPERFR